MSGQEEVKLPTEIHTPTSYTGLNKQEILEQTIFIFFIINFLISFLVERKRKASSEPGDSPSPPSKRAKDSPIPPLQCSFFISVTKKIGMVVERGETGRRRGSEKAREPG